MGEENPLPFGAPWWSWEAMQELALATYSSLMNTSFPVQDAYHPFIDHQVVDPANNLFSG
jgi:hypothetical protein